MVNSFLQLAVAVPRTQDTALGYRNMAQTDVKGQATLSSVTVEAGVGMPGENQLQAVPPHLLEMVSVGRDNHSINNGGGAGQLGLSYSLYFDDAEAAGSVRPQFGQRLQVRVVTEGRDIDASLLGHLEYSRALFGLNLLAIDVNSGLFHFRKSNLFHFAPRIEGISCSF